MLPRYVTLFIWTFLYLFVSATSIDFLTVTVSDLLEQLEQGQVTSEQLVTSYLSEIDQNNNKGLHLRAVLETAPRDSVIQFARTLDQERSQGIIRGPLHGIPILIKDNIATDASLGMNTTAGSFALSIPFRSFD
jgi:amidase